MQTRRKGENSCIRRSAAAVAEAIEQRILLSAGLSTETLRVPAIEVAPHPTSSQNQLESADDAGKVFPPEDDDPGDGADLEQAPLPVDPQPIGAVSSSLPVVGGPWTFAGPGPILGGQVPGGGVVSGRITSIAASSSDVNTLYIGAAGGGIWKTTNGGTSWAALTDSQPTGAIGAIALAPSNQNIIYAGTGEANNSVDSVYGTGVLKSTDAGATWTLVGTSSFNRNAFSKIVVDPSDPNTVYAAVSNASNGVGSGWGIWKTTDGGANWTNTTNSLFGSSPCSDLVMDPTNHLVLYGAVGSAGGNTNNGIYKTINGGTTWTRITAFPLDFGTNNSAGRLSLGMTANSAASAAPILYASVENKSTSGVLGVYKSPDGGVTWTAITPGSNYMGGQGWYDQYIAVAPTDLTQNTVFVGGAAGSTAVLESTDGGSTWSNIPTGVSGNNGPHADHHAGSFDANGRLLDGNDGGIWRLDNPATASILWTDLNSNLGITQFQGVAIDNAATPGLFGGSQDNGTSNTTGGATSWNLREGGDGGLVSISPNNSSRIYHIAPVGSFGTAAFFRRSDNGGTSWISVPPAIGSDSTNFYPPFVVDPTYGVGGNDRVLLGTNHIYETTNNGTSWTQLTTTVAAGWTVTSTVGALATAGNTIYASAGGHTFVSTDDGTTWTEHDVSGTAGISELIVDPATPQTAYAVLARFTGSSAGKIYRTTNGGTTWTDISGNLPDLPIHAVVSDPQVSGDVVYVATDSGVYTSSNLGASWSQLGTNLPGVQVYDLRINKNGVLAAGTHGRGAWTIATVAPVVTGIAGEIFNDVNGNRVKDSGDAGLPGWTVYLDQNSNHQLDSATNNVSSIDVPKAIPDGPGGAVTSVLPVSGIANAITSVTMTFNITHTYDQDLQAFLISPLGTRIELFNGTGSSGDNFTNTMLSDSGSTPISAGSAPFTGTYTPDQPLSTFSGESANGTWSFEVHDNAALDTGTIQSWSLSISTGETSTTSDAGGNYIFAGLTAGASYHVAEVHQPTYSQTLPSVLSPTLSEYSITATSGTTASANDFGNYVGSVASVSANLSVSGGGTTAVPGKAMTYILAVRNDGTSGVTGVSVADALSASLDPFSVTYTATDNGVGATGYTAAGSGAITDTVSLLPGAIITYSISGNILPSKTVSLTSFATASSAAGIVNLESNVNGSTVANQASSTVTLTPMAELGVVMNGANPLHVGQQDVYSIVVTNFQTIAAGSDAVGTTINTDALAQFTGIHFSTAVLYTPDNAVTPTFTTGSGTVSNGAAFNDTFSLSSGSIIEFQITGTVAAGATGTIANTTTVADPGFDVDASNNSSSVTAAVATVNLGSVVGRSLFYGNSFWDNPVSNPSFSKTPDTALAPDKLALMPGQKARFNNYSSYQTGIDGIFVDITGDVLHTISLTDFTFTVGNDNSPNGWTAAPTPTSISLYPGAGVNGSDRVQINWADSAILDKWLQVTVLATKVDTNLAVPDIFYFGNAPGEVGNSTSDAFVNASDDIAARNDVHTTVSDPATLGNPHDYNRDSKVNGTDEIFDRGHHTNGGNGIFLITPSTPGVFTLISRAAPSPTSTAPKPAAIATISSLLLINSGDDKKTHKTSDLATASIVEEQVPVQTHAATKAKSVPPLRLHSGIGAK